MWKWIASVWKKGDYVPDLKRKWLNEIADEKYLLWNNCFFCERAVSQRPSRDDAHPEDYIKGDGCEDYCPGTKIDKHFDCDSREYGYRVNPPAFYAELLRLNRIRKGKK
jgi:hypothetical protein